MEFYIVRNRVSQTDNIAALLPPAKLVNLVRKQLEALLLYLPGASVLSWGVASQEELMDKI